MAGPLVHKSSMENLRDMLNRDGISINAGSSYDVMVTDLEYDSHGYSMETGEGSIFDKINSVVTSMSGITNLNSFMTLFETYCRHICHFCTDSMTIGQISRDLWGKYDDKFDILGELVPYKRDLGLHDGLVYPLTPEQIKSSQLQIMQSIFNNHRSRATKWNYVLSGNFRNMIREAVYYGSFYAYQWVKLALK